MNEMLRDEVKKLWPTVRQRSLNFAICPNGGDPVLVLSKRDLNLQKFASRMAKAKKKVDTAQVWFGTVSKVEDKFVFEYAPDQSKGEVRVAGFRKALKALGNDKELKLPVLVKARIHGPGLEDGLSLESTSSNWEKIFGSDFRTVEQELAKAKDPDKSASEREAALDKVQTASARWLRDNAGKTDPEGEAQRQEVWELYKTTTAASGAEAADEDLEFIGTMMGRQVAALEALEDAGGQAYADAVEQAVSDIEMFLEMALESEADGATEAVEQLIRLYLDAAERKDALLDPDPVDRDEANEAIVDGVVDLEALFLLDATDEEIGEKVRDLEDLRARCSRDGLFEQVEVINELLEMASKPWCFEDTGTFQRRYRIDLKAALANAGKHDSETQVLLLRGWEDQLDGVGEDDPGLIIEFPVISLAYGVQQLKESHPKVWEIIESALEDDGDGRGRGSVADTVRKERLDRLFGDPRELRKRASRRLAIDEQSTEIVETFDWEAYDRLFDEDKLEGLQTIVDEADTATEALTSMLWEEDEGVALSEDHSRGDVKKLIVDSLETLVEQGLDTLYIEHFRRDEHQALLDAFMETGEEPDALADYLDAQARRHNPNDESGPPAHKDVDLRAILKQAWAVQESSGTKVRLVAIDSMDAKADPDGDPSLWGEQRTKRMNGLASSIIEGDTGRKGKFLVLAGSAHNQTHPGGERGIPGLGQLCKVPVMTLDGTGGPKLQVEDKDERHATPVRGGKAVLVKASMGTVGFEKTDSLRHVMPFEMTLQIPEDVTGADYAKGGEDALSVYGARFEWWERIEVHWDFKPDNPEDEEDVAAKKEAGAGGSLKAWGDLYRAKPRAGTYRFWVGAVDEATRGELGAGRKTIRIEDKPAVTIAAGWFTKRVLRFRIVARDGYGKREVIEATQVCVIENGAAVHASYADTAGNRHSWTADTYDKADVSAEDEEVAFDLDEDLPPEKWGGVRDFLTEIAKKQGSAFVNKELAFIRELRADSNCLDSEDLLYERFIGQAYCGLPPTSGDEAYVQTAAPGGGLLIAKVRGDEPLAMWFTTDTAGPERLIVVQSRPEGETKQYRRGGRTFVELPFEVVRRMGGGR